MTEKLTLINKAEFRRKLATRLYFAGFNHDKRQEIGEIIAMLDVEPATTTSFTKATWIKDKEDCYWGNSFIRRYCSNCGKSPYFDRETRQYMYSPHCPNCGAKMEEKTNETFSN